ncbi:sulfite oxidase [Strigomonas culicis]|uniref:Sulfite oxidase n=1 Tax=Strigomonas culicis TaxID=28005 RepID=S9TE68_9TRYP|nr:sulfite oxidase [Strigomonas culicis]|eukprot:EPY15254.1 sulfite oxidase [Strigomonas culicis]
MLAAGGGIDKWWAMFNIHDDDAVRDILERHRIGNVKDYVPQPVVSLEDQWAAEPTRADGLRVLNSRPFNAETPEAALREYITPTELFFVRGHMPVPDLKNRPDFCVMVEGEGMDARCFTVEDLKRQFEEHTETVTIQCGGNRRTTMEAAYAADGAKGVKGLSWKGGAIGTADWTGVYLRDVIAACQVEPPYDPASYHVQFEGADRDAAGHFQASIPYNMATSPDADVLIAYKMNGEDLPPDHGYPLRAIVPGVVGVRNCKFLQRVTVQPDECESVWQQNDYKNFPSYETKPNHSYPSIYYMPVQSQLTHAAYNPEADAIQLQAYAYAGGGRGIQRVEVSHDNGRSFEYAATLQPRPQTGAASQEEASFPHERQWAWRQVVADTPVKDIKAAPVVRGDGTKVYLTCIRAVTTDNEVQPAVAPYNFRGLLYNGYSCKDIAVK